MMSSFIGVIWDFLQTYYNTLDSFLGWIPVKYIFIMLGLVLLAVFLPNLTVGNLFRLMDWYLFKSTVKDSRKNIFEKGMGEKARWEMFLNYKIPVHVKGEKMKSLGVTWKHKEMQMVNRKGMRYYKNIGQFPAPQPFGNPKTSNDPFLLRKGEEVAEFGYFKTYKEKKADTVLFFLAAVGQQGFGDRMSILGNTCLRSNIDCVLPIPSMYGSRKSKDQLKFGITFQTVIDSPIGFHSTILEVRELVRYFGDHQGYKNIVITGMSMGGMLTTKVAQILLKFKRKDVNVAVVPFLPYASIAPFGPFRDLLEKNLKDNDTIPVKELEEKTQFKTFKKVITVLTNLEETPYEAIRDKKNLHGLAKIKLVKVIHGKYDWVLPKNLKNDAEREMKDLAKQRKAKFVVKKLSCGHFAAFLLAQVHNKYRQEIQKAVTFLRKGQ